jgi:LPXTG-motif cell wall-anchored protein
MNQELTFRDLGLSEEILKALDIQLAGNNKLTNTANNGVGIWVDDDVTIASNNNGDLSIVANSMGIHTDYGDITIKSGIVSITSNNDGIYANEGDMIISGGIVNVDATDQGISTSYNTTISGGTVTATGNGGGAGIGVGYDGNMAGTITIADGTVNAQGAGNAAGIGAGNDGDLDGTVEITGGTVIANGGNNAAGIGCGARGFMNGNVIIKGGSVTAVAGKTSMQSATEPASAIGASCHATLSEDAVIEVNPASGKIAVKAGADEGNAAALVDSPFAAKTSLKEALKEKQYAKFEFIAPPATPVPSPTPAPGIPETGDSMNFALLAVLAAMGMLGITVLLRKKNEA